MKKYAVLLTIIAITSCSKEDIEQPKQEPEQTICKFPTVKSSEQMRKFYGPLGHLKQGPPKNYPILLLDFNGYTFPDGKTVNGAGMSTQSVQQVLDMVVFAFRDERVYITTNEKLYERTPITKRQRIVFSDDPSWEVNIGGFAYMNSFGQGELAAFVLTDELGYNPKFVGVAAVHESGHTLNLDHQAEWVNGVLFNTYHPGDINVAPYMGMAYYTNNPSWWIGLTPSGVAQDDIALIKTKLNSL